MIPIQLGFCKEPMVQRAPAGVKERGQADELRNVENLNRHSYSLYNLKEEKRRNAFWGAYGFGIEYSNTFVSGQPSPSLIRKEKSGIEKN